eukprot:EG_transcript_24404
MDNGRAAERKSCRYCDVDLDTTNVHIKCAECVDLHLCVDCFSVGVEIGPHKAAHDYFVQDSHCLPVFREGWSAADEMHLLDGLEIVGWGNWTDVEEHVGKSAKECRRHYYEVYLDSATAPLPDLAHSTSSSSSGADLPHCCPNHHYGSNRRKRSSSTLKVDQYSTYIPQRGEFLVESGDDAEKRIVDLEWHEEADPREKEFVIRLLEQYDRRVSRRLQLRTFAVHHDLAQHDERAQRFEQECFDDPEPARPFARFLRRAEWQAFAA